MCCGVVGAAAAVTEAADTLEKSKTEEEKSTDEPDDINQKSDNIPTIVPTDSPIQQGVETAPPAGQNDATAPFVAININDGAANNEDTAESAIKPAGLKM